MKGRRLELCSSKPWRSSLRWIHSSNTERMQFWIWWIFASGIRMRKTIYFARAALSFKKKNKGNEIREKTGESERERIGRVLRVQWPDGQTRYSSPRNPNKVPRGCDESPFWKGFSQLYNPGMLQWLFILSFHPVCPFQRQIWSSANSPPREWNSIQMFCTKIEFRFAPKIQLFCGAIEFGCHEDSAELPTNCRMFRIRRKVDVD